MGFHAGGMSTTHSVAKPMMCMSRFSTQSAEDLPHQRFSQKEYMLMSTQLDLPEWLGVRELPLLQIPPEYENFYPSAGPKSVRGRNNSRLVRLRPGLWELSAEEFHSLLKKDSRRLLKCQKYLAERRRRRAMRAQLARLVAPPDGGVASAVVAAEVNVEVAEVSRNAPPAPHSAATDQEEIAFDEYMAERIDAAEFDRRKAEARAKATAEHAPLTELERASAEYMEAVSARTKAEAALSTSEAAEDAAEAKLEAVLRGLERGQAGSSGVKAES